MVVFTVFYIAHKNYRQEVVMMKSWRKTSHCNGESPPPHVKSSTLRGRMNICPLNPAAGCSKPQKNILCFYVTLALILLDEDWFIG